MNAEKVTRVGKKVETESVKEVETENAREVGTENSEEKGREMKKENNDKNIAKGSDGSEPEARRDVEMSKSALKKYCFIRGRTLNGLKDDYKLETGSVFSESVILVLADPPHTTHSARGQSSSANDVLSKRNVEHAVRLIGSVMALGRRGQMFCSDVVFRQWNRSLHAAEKGEDDVERNLERLKEKALEVLQLRGPGNFVCQALWDLQS